MRILITGGAGFIGSHIQDKLIQLKHQVAVVDNLRSGKKEFLHPQTQFFLADIRDRKKILTIFTKVRPQAVFHLAAQNEVPYSMDHPDEDLETNVGGTLNILEACRMHHTPKIIYSNTGGALYGEVKTAQLPISEDFPIKFPTSFYGVSKGAAERYVMLYGQIYGLQWVSLRYANVFGPRQDSNHETGVVAIFTNQLLKHHLPIINGDGKHGRDYIYISDVVSATIAALSYPRNDFFNISVGKCISTLKVFAIIESQLKTGIKPHFGPPRPGDPRLSSLSPAKANKLLKWQAKVDLTTGIRLTLDYYRSRP